MTNPFDITIDYSVLQQDIDDADYLISVDTEEETETNIQFE